MAHHIGIAILSNGKVSVRVRAESEDGEAIGDFVEVMDHAAFEAAGWETDEPLTEGATVRVLEFQPSP